MRQLSAFLFLTVNGLFKGANDDISWHRHGEEESNFAKQGAGSGSVLLFGRKTYEMMASYWPSPLALEQNGAVADGMNRSEKIVFSQTLTKADWQNTRILSDNITDKVSRLKGEQGPDMTILGSGSIVTQFAEAGLIDHFQLMIDPVAIGQGTPLFQQLRKTLNLTLLSTHAFKSGVVLLNYKPA